MFVEQQVDVELTFDSFWVLIHRMDQMNLILKKFSMVFYFSKDEFTLMNHLNDYLIFFHWENFSKEISDK
jgi:hypothetical protein